MTHPIVGLILSKLTGEGFSSEALAELAAAFKGASKDPAAVAAVYETVALLGSGPAPAASEQLTALIVELLANVAVFSVSAQMTGREHPFQRFGGRSTKVDLSKPTQEGLIPATRFAVPRRA